ncbi:MAG TPA: acyl carrier protein [Terracidiphilus sp.]|nr:acyl carrier protein [Terracidiphilus sp.]
MDRVIGKELRAFIYQNFLLGQDFVLGDSDSFLENGVIDSMGVLELVAFLQETYGITVENEELIPDNLDTLEKLTAYVTRKLDGRVTLSAQTGAREGL